VVGGERTEDDEVDAFLGSLGFEFTDAQIWQCPLLLMIVAVSIILKLRRNFPDRFTVTGVSRAIDALSTIMWPSMIQKSSRGSGHGFLRTTYGSLITTHPARGCDRMQQELEALERWLDEDNSDDHF
jgi:hypothetical protein